MCWVIISMNLVPREYMPFPKCSVTHSPQFPSRQQCPGLGSSNSSVKEGLDSKIQSFQGFTLCLLLSSDSYKIQFGKAMP